MPNRRTPLQLSLAALLTTGSLLISGCAADEEPILMPPAEITRYVLDLSGSNDYMEQWERLKPKIYSDLKSEALGNPFGEKLVCPKELSITFILRNASQAKVIKISSSEFGALLYEELGSVYERSPLQLINDWPLVLATYRVALDQGFTDIGSCAESSWDLMRSQMGESLSKIIANRICVFAVSILNKLEISIPATLSPGGGSDVFGSLREIQSWAKKLRESNPQVKIKVVFASDMVHNTDGKRDLFGDDGLLTGKIAQKEICEIANSQAVLSALELSNVSLEIIGRGNASSVSGDEADALAIFWNCFAEASKLEINFSTDGSD